MASRRGFGNVRRLPSKRWQAFYRHDGTRHTAPSTFTAKMDAEAWLGQERRLIERDEWTPPAARREAAEAAEAERAANTFEPYARAWLAGRHDLRPTTRSSYSTSIERHLVPTFGPLPLTEISLAKVRAWFSSYGTKTPTARAHAYQVLQSIMSQAEDDELITRTPCRIRAGGRTVVKREPEVLSLPDLLALTEAMPEQHRAMTLVCGMCGLRFGEAAALRRRDLDLDAALIHVQRTAVRTRGKKTVNKPKTAAGERTVTMPAIVVDALRKHLASLDVSGREALVFPGADGELLAPSTLYGNKARTVTKNGKQYAKNATGFFKAREAIGRPNLHWHDLRRTAATLGAQSGATVREMQHRLGHTTPTMALMYQGASAERDRAIADRLQAQVEALAGHGTVTEMRNAK